MRRRELVTLIAAWWPALCVLGQAQYGSAPTFARASGNLLIAGGAHRAQHQLAGTFCPSERVLLLLAATQPIGGTYPVRALPTAVVAT